SISLLNNRITAIEEKNLLITSSSNRKYYGGEIPPPPISFPPIPYPPHKENFPEDVGELISLKDFDDLENGEKVYHQRFGYGHIFQKINGNGDERVEVNFLNAGKKTLLFKLTNLYRVSDQQ